MDDQSRLDDMRQALAERDQKREHSNLILAAVTGMVAFGVCWYIGFPMWLSGSLAIATAVMTFGDFRR